MSGAAIHGGNVWEVALDHNVAPEELLDFSANINPRGLPERARRQLARDASDARLLMRYPDPSALALRETLSAQLQVPIESIVVGAGAEALLGASLRSFGVRRCLVPVPAFSEYRRACSACGAELHAFELQASRDFLLDVDRFCRALQDGRFDTAILNNPHNPSGALLETAELETILATCAQSGTRLLVDEAFIDYAGHASLGQQASQMPGVIAVRSLTKFYGCPGLRVGYAIGSPESVARIAEVSPTWPVTLLAINALREALLDVAFARETLRDNLLERVHLAAGIADLGACALPSAANYLLVRLPPNGISASLLHRRLIREYSILVRNCDSFDGLKTGQYIRVAVRSTSENDRLLGALKLIMRG